LGFSGGRGRRRSESLRVGRSESGTVENCFASIRVLSTMVDLVVAVLIVIVAGTESFRKMHARRRSWKWWKSFVARAR